MKRNIKEELQKILGKDLKLSEPMKKHTTFSIGGPAEYFYEADTREDLIKAIQTAQSLRIPFFILGSGSNILVSDKGIKGLVIKNQSEEINKKKNCLTADSGVLLRKLVDFSIKSGLSGLHYFAGIPGTVGGAIYNNAHFSEHFIADRLFSVEVITSKGKVKKIKRENLEFSYDYSSFQKNKMVILRACFCLKKGKKQKLQKEAERYLKDRIQKHPLDKKSAGCIFKNPPNNLPAGLLIVKVNLAGYKIGGAQVSDKHSNFIINTGNATCQDVLSLIKLIKKKVKDKFGVRLEEEIFIVGE